MPVRACTRGVRGASARLGSHLQPTPFCSVIRRPRTTRGRRPTTAHMHSRWTQSTSVAPSWHRIGAFHARNAPRHTPPISPPRPHNCWHTGAALPDRSRPCAPALARRRGGATPQALAGQMRRVRACASRSVARSPSSPRRRAGDRAVRISFGAGRLGDGSARGCAAPRRRVRSAGAPGSAHPLPPAPPT